MLIYLLKRLAQSAITVLFVVAIIFVVIRLIGDPTHLLLPPEATEADRVVLRHQMGLDRPVLVQFGAYLAQLARGDFGISYRFSLPAGQVALHALPPTLMLASAALVLALGIGIPLGVAAAIWPGSVVDQFGQIFAVLGQAAPPFFFSLLFVKLFSLHWAWLPTGGYGTPAHLVLPALALGWFAAAGVARLTRSSMTDVLGAEFVKFARIKGLAEQEVILRHALRNALLPVVTYVTLQFGLLIGGAVSVEVVFAWPGIGQLLYDSINNLDYTVVQAAVTLTAAIFVLINLLVDVAYALIDPRIQHG